jgi:DNA topoisomerase-1
MSKNLVIVESPAKAKTINKYLGKDFDVLASYGHVRDLVPKEGAVDPARGFAMKYDVIERNQRHVHKIEQSLKNADALYLATDPDREGEAIAWHLYELLRQNSSLDDKPVRRVVFHEITQRAVDEAIQHPRDISASLVDAQQARRALDYLVGFNLSPLLWKKVRRGLSAGRVQSPALRLICERENEIEAFKPREYWSIEAKLNKEAQGFAAKLTEFAGEKVEQFTVTDEARATEVKQALEQAAQGALRVESVEKKQRRRNPAPPFTTSTLQQEASRKLGFTASRTMRVAQQLYEGIDLGGDAVGLITYMRTDSVNLAQEAVNGLRDVISQRYGNEALPGKARVFKTKSKNAQEAHEGIRPTSAARTPDSLKGTLSADQAKLYDLIWKRTLACQMRHALFNTVGLNLKPQAAPEGHTFRATGSTLVEPGFMAVYQEGRDDAKKDNDESNTLPPVAEGESLALREIAAEQHFTEPPPRFTEASLVKTLEEYGIGRPSTYASIISTLVNREYVTLEKKRFTATDVGRVVNKFLTAYFPRYVDYEFTARLEDQLDAVSRDEKAWVPLLEDFWGPFKERVDDTETNVKRSDVTSETIDEACPKCGQQLTVRLGRRGRFIGCSGYPDCDYTRSLDDNKEDEEKDQQLVEGRECPKCGSALAVRQGRYGKFIGCTAYPKCKYLEPLNKPRDTGVTCPQCGEGSLLERKSRYGKLFYPCNRYPKCKYAVNNPPLAEACPRCDWPILTVKTTKRRGTERVCPQKECDHAEPAPELAPEASSEA